MKKTILATVVAATLSISSVSFAGDIEKVVEMDVSAAKTEQKIVASPELSFGLGSNAEVQELGLAGPVITILPDGTIIIRY